VCLNYLQVRAYLLRVPAESLQEGRSLLGRLVNLIVAPDSPAVRQVRSTRTDFLCLVWALILFADVSMSAPDFPAVRQVRSTCADFLCLVWALILFADVSMSAPDFPAVRQVRSTRTDFLC